MSDWWNNNKENIILIIKIIIVIFLIFIFAWGFQYYVNSPSKSNNSSPTLANVPPKSDNLLSNSVNPINTIELTIRGQTGIEEYSIESLTGDILVPKRIAPKSGEIISFNTHLPSIILNRSRSGKELFLRKIEKNKEELLQSRISSVIRGDFHFNNMTDEPGKISRQQDVNEGKLKWPIKYQIDIGL